MFENIANMVTRGILKNPTDFLLLLKLTAFFAKWRQRWGIQMKMKMLAGSQQKRQEAAAELMKERKRNKVQDAEMAMWMSFCRTGKITILEFRSPDYHSRV